LRRKSPRARLLEHAGDRRGVAPQAGISVCSSAFTRLFVVRISRRVGAGASPRGDAQGWVRMRSKASAVSSTTTGV